MYVLSVVNNVVISSLFTDKDVEFEFQTVREGSLLNLLEMLKMHSLTQLSNLVELTAVDQPQNALRFIVSYFLLSVHYNARVRVSVQTDDLNPIISTTRLFNSTNWPEREVWDMYGVSFLGHTDLRRLLTDYGFQGFPLRKDFPLSGFTDVYYDDSRKLLKYTPVSISQSFRKFSFLSPWIQDK